MSETPTNGGAVVYEYDCYHTAGQRTYTSAEEALADAAADFEFNNAHPRQIRVDGQLRYDRDAIIAEAERRFG